MSTFLALHPDHQVAVLLAAACASGLFVWVIRRTKDRIAHERAVLVQAEYESWAKPVTVHFTDEPWTPTRTGDEAQFARWVDTAIEMERLAGQATADQAEAYANDLPYDQEKDQ